MRPWPTAGLPSDTMTHDQDEDHGNVALERAGIMSNLDAEKAVLGAMLIEPGRIPTVMPILPPRAFYKPAHETICAAIYHLYEQQQPVDAITVDAFLRDAGEGERTGGGVYLHTLLQTVVTASSAVTYAGIVAEEFVRRRALAALTRGTQLILQRGEGGTTGTEVLDVVRAEIEAVMTDAAFDADRLPTFTERFATSLESMEDRTKNDVLDGVPSGLADLDNLLGGFRDGNMIVVAGQSGHGKSVLVGIFAATAAAAGFGVLVVTREMSAEEYMERWISRTAQVPYSNVRSPKSLDNSHWGKIAGAAAKSDIALFIDDESETIEQIKSRAMTIDEDARRGKGVPLKVIVIDYLQLLTPADTRMSRTEQVAAMSRSIKAWAPSKKYVVIVVASLSKTDENNVPRNSDLRDSGSIEFDANVIIMVHRPDKNEPESPRAGEVDLHITKHRGGPQGTITAAFRGHYQDMSDLTYRNEPA